MFPLNNLVFCSTGRSKAPESCGHWPPYSPITGGLTLTTTKLNPSHQAKPLPACSASCHWHIKRLTSPFNSAVAFWRARSFATFCDHLALTFFLVHLLFSPSLDGINQLCLPVWYIHYEHLTVCSSFSLITFYFGILSDWVFPSPQVHNSGRTFQGFNPASDDTRVLSLNTKRRKNQSAKIWRKVKTIVPSLAVWNVPQRQSEIFILLHSALSMIIFSTMMPFFVMTAASQQCWWFRVCSIIHMKTARCD